MELLKALWFISFCLFALTLIYVWSRVLVVSGRIRAIDGILNKFEELSAVSGGSSPQPGREDAQR